MTTFLFPGQGSQAKGMGSTLFAEFPDMAQQADAILGYSIASLCVDDPNNQLNQTNFTQPALYVVNALSYAKKLQEDGKEPAFVAGHSLGEYNALLAAGVFDFETGLRLVQKRGALMSLATGGGMAAVIGLTGDKVEQTLKENNLTSIGVANYNSNSQIVISGPKENILAAEEVFKKAGASLFIPLKVSGAFHSSLMNKAQEEFSTFAANFTFSAPKITVIANLNAKPYQQDNILQTLTQQINHPVLWTQSINYLLAQGETVFTEIGPGKVLAGLVNKILKGQ